MEAVGGRATSGLQGEYGQVGSAPDRLGGLDLIAGRRQHSGHQGVFVLMCLLCVVVRRKPGANGPQRSRASGDRIKKPPRNDSWTTFVIV